MGIHTGSRQKNNGVTIENAYNVRLRRRTGSGQMIVLLQPLLLIAGVLSTIYCLVTSLGMSVDHRRLIVWIVMIGLVFWGAVQMQSFAYTLVPCMLFIFFLYIYDHVLELLQGFYHVENYVIRLMRSYFHSSQNYYVVEQRNGTREVTVLLIVLAFIVTAVSLIPICTGYLRSVYLLITVAAVAGPCILGQLPNPYIIVLHVMVIIGILGGSSVRRGDSRQRAGAGGRHLRLTGISIGLVCVLISSGILMVLSVVLNKRVYERMPIGALKHEIQTKMNDVGHKLGKKGALVNTGGPMDYVGGLAGGRLNHETGRIIYRHTPQLKLTMIKPDGPVYLRGFTGVNYENERWASAGKDQKDGYDEVLGEIQNGFYNSDELSILSLDFLASGKNFPEMELRPSDITIEYVGANEKFLYHPYYSAPGGFIGANGGYDYGSLEYQEEGISPKEEQHSYRLHYYDASLKENKLDAVNEFLGGFSRQMPTISDGAFLDHMILNYDYLRTQEESYRRYVYRTYLSIPETGLEQLKMEFLDYRDELEADAGGAVSIADAVKYVRDYLYDTAEYTLAPGVTPENEDFIEYFLYTNKRGYCVHYASSAVMMLRCLGIPARYVEGYYVSQDVINNGKVLPVDSTQVAGSGMVISNGKAQQEVRPVISVDVDDSCAHAWVEVYIDRFGWYPVEFTEPAHETRIQENVPDHKENEKIDRNEKKEKPKPEKKEEKKSDQQKKQEPVDKKQQKKEQKKQAGPSVNWAVVRGILLVVLVAALIASVPMYRAVFWRKYLRKHNRSQIYKAFYEKLERMSGHSEGMEELQQKLTKDEWKRNQKRYQGLEYEEARQLRESYLSVLYSGRVMNKEEFQEARQVFRKWYGTMNESKPRLVRLWRKYYMTIYL